MSIRNKLNGVREILHFDNRFEILRKRLSGETKIHYRIRGLDILVDHAEGDANGAREVITSDMYRRFFPFLGLSEPINVLDIGANNGGFALLLKYERIPIKKLVAVEFNPATFDRLRHNVVNNFEEEVSLVNAAVCGNSRTVKTSANATGTSASIYGSSENPDSEEIRGMTLNELIGEHFEDKNIDLCKIDVEGSEFEIFAGNHAGRVQQIKHLLLEIHHSEATPREPVISQIEAFGFEEVNVDNERRNDLHYVHLFRNTSL